MDDETFYGVLLVVMLIMSFLVVCVIGVYLWIEAFLAGDRLVVFVSGCLTVLVVVVPVWLLGRRFEIVRREPKE